MSWTFVYLMIGLKIPIAALLYLVWWAIHQTDEPSEKADDGGSGRPRHPRRPLGGRPRRRGPHGAPLPASPARTRTMVVRGRVTGGHPRVPSR